ncbi:phage holin family protein [Roseovarius sp. M141]|uniref:phage holin family protein n=1 Tax=Roseovarius sp. M141 TaxID=2583806 RepID=UPI0020CF7B36|nr:phage holin family protein [Roseovarius sp. M141]MCQ0093747.1 phage holin family protein [Roseovarius sp. M141]
MGLVSAVKDRSARAIRRALICVVGGIFVSVGLGFLTSAAWIMLEDAYSAFAAALILAGIYTGTGLIALGVASSSSKRDADATPPLSDPATPPKPGATPPLAEAFIIGFNAALAARGRGPTDGK